ncbi:MAG: hypothetical protein GF308_07005 [Candidatus Heimdallarchaeota archaeon]|nr:hypothetical protein [Candidatus Heimdallarchaeota archaeon]
MFLIPTPISSLTPEALICASKETLEEKLRSSNISFTLAMAKAFKQSTLHFTFTKQGVTGKIFGMKRSFFSTNLKKEYSRLAGIADFTNVELSPLTRKEWQAYLLFIRGDWARKTEKNQLGLVSFGVPAYKVHALPPIDEAIFRPD